MTHSSKNPVVMAIVDTEILQLLANAIEIAPNQSVYETDQQ